MSNSQAVGELSGIMTLALPELDLLEFFSAQTPLLGLLGWGLGD